MVEDEVARRSLALGVRDSGTDDARVAEERGGATEVGDGGSGGLVAGGGDSEVNRRRGRAGARGRTSSGVRRCGFWPRWASQGPIWVLVGRDGGAVQGLHGGGRLVRSGVGVAAQPVGARHLAAVGLAGAENEAKVGGGGGWRLGEGLG